MSQDSSGYGQWLLVLLNSVIFNVFAVSTGKSSALQSARDGSDVTPVVVPLLPAKL